MYGRLARPKKTGHNNEATIRQCSTAPELRLVLKFGDLGKVSLFLEQRCPFISWVTGTKINMRTFFQDQILCPMNGGFS